MRAGTCTKIVLAHTWDVQENHGADYPKWKQRHSDAWMIPVSASEVGVKRAIEGYAALADAYSNSFPDSLIGQDGYFGEHALGMLQAINAWLNMGSHTRFDSGAVSRLLSQLAKASGVNPDEV